MNHARSGGSQACAACKYQRRKCAPNCPLAPYFPSDQQKQFLNAHRLFGVSNIMKTLRNLNPQEKEVAMKSMIFQANARALDPVGGCHRIICEYQRQIDFAKAELELVLQQIAMCRIELQQPAPISGTTTSNVNVDNMSGLYDSDSDKGDNGVVHQELQQYGFQENFYEHNLQDCGIRIKGDEASSSCSSVMHVKRQVLEECEDLKPVFIPFDSKESIQCSDNVTKEEVAINHHPKEEQDLKCAASLFSLTNCNG